MLRHTFRTLVGTETFRVTAADRLEALITAIFRLDGDAEIHAGDLHVTVATGRPLERADVMSVIEAAGLTCLD